MIHPRHGKMAVTRLYILQHVLKISDIDTEGQNMFLSHGIGLVRKIINTIYEV